MAGGCAHRIPRRHTRVEHEELTTRVDGERLCGGQDLPHRKARGYDNDSAGEEVMHRCPWCGHPCDCDECDNPEQPAHDCGHDCGGDDDEDDEWA